MKSTLILLTSSLIPAFAGEHVVEPTLFETTLSFDATFLPKTAHVITIQPEEWSQYKITSLVDHGAVVKKGDVLIQCDATDYERHLTEQKAASQSRKIALARTQRELADLEITTPRQLEKAKRTFEREKESLAHFKKTGRALEEKAAHERLERSQSRLESVEEELKQLLKMYEEDGVTEETEEIILKRQRSAVKSTKLALEQAQASHKWAIEKTIPRKAIDTQASFDAAKTKYETSLKNLPRKLEEKRLSVAKSVRENQHRERTLALLEKDAAFHKIIAPEEGAIFYGQIKNGKWSLGLTPKFLFKHGKLPANQSLLTLVPTAAPLELYTEVSQKERLNLKTELTGTASVEGLENKRFPVTLNAIDTYPRANSKYQVALSVELPKESTLTTGMKAKVKIVTYRKENALTVPEKAITTKDQKSTVKIKLADGKSEIREVEIGRKNKGKVEILSGLEASQVVLTPDKGGKK